MANAPSIDGHVKFRRRKRTRSSSGRRNTQADTYVCIDEMIRRGSQPLDDDVKDSASNWTMRSGSLTQGKRYQNSLCIPETEMPHMHVENETHGRERQGSYRGHPVMLDCHFNVIFMSEKRDHLQAMLNIYFPSPPPNSRSLPSP